MKRIEWTLQKQNYRVINVAYPSTRVSIQDAADHWLADVLKTQTTDPTVKIILCRPFASAELFCHAANIFPTARIFANLRSRVAVLAPPNQGSEMAQRLRKNRLYKLFTCPSGQQAGTDRARSLPNQLWPRRFRMASSGCRRSLAQSAVLVVDFWCCDDGRVSGSHQRQTPGIAGFSRRPSVPHLGWGMGVVEVDGAVARFS